MTAAIIRTRPVSDPVARLRLLSEAQGILSDPDTPEFRKEYAAEFLKRNRDPLSVAMLAGLNAVERMDGWIVAVSDEFPGEA